MSDASSECTASCTWARRAEPSALLKRPHRRSVHGSAEAAAPPNRPRPVEAPTDADRPDVRGVWTSVGRMAQPGEWTTGRLAAALSEAPPKVLRRLSAGIAILGHAEEPPGSCALVLDDPLVQRLTDLPRERRLTFLGDMDLLAEAVHNVCRRHEPGFLWVDLAIGGGGDLLSASVRPRHRRESGTRDRHDDLRAQLVDEIDFVRAAGRGDHPAQHVYGPRRTR